ncbi:MAG: MFS transporter [Pseudomonadota bacterium]
MHPVLILLLSIGAVGSNSLVLSPIAAEIALEFNAAPAVILRASALFGAATALSALTLAPRADGWGLGRSLRGAMAALALAFGLSAGATGPAMLMGAQALAGLAAGLALPATYGLAADVAPKGREAATLSRVLLGWTLSLVLGVAASAAIADAFGWRMVYGLLGLVALGVTLAGGPLEQAAPPRDVPKTAPLTGLRLPGVPPLLASVAAYMTAFYGLYAYLGTHIGVGLGLGTTVAGFGALAYGLGFGGAATLGGLIDRLGSARAAPLVFGALITAYLALAVSAGVPALLIAMCALWGVVNHLGLNLLVGQLSAAAPARRGTVMGLYSATTYLAMSLGTAGFGPAFTAFGFAVPALMAAALVALSLGLALRTRRRARAL